MEEILPPPLEVIVAAVLSGGWIHAGAVGRRMGVSRQAAHRLLLRLGGDGLVAWDEREAWVRSARITPAGREALAAGYEALEDVRAAIERLPVAERKVVVSAERSIHRELRRPSGWEPWTPWVPGEQIAPRSDSSTR